MIFTSYNPDHVDEGYHVFLDLSKQHTVIFKKLESLRNKLQKRKPFDLSELKKLLIKHKNFEEQNVYPVLDQEIEEDEKHFIIGRINEIIKEK